MTVVNETASPECRFLGEDYFHPLYETFIEAFSDYVFPFALTETQFRNHINLNAVDLAKTVGSFDGDRLVGFSLNGFGDWNGRHTAYDAGTGVVPSRRRRGFSAAMFDYMLPKFEADGIDQVLLEVITTNDGAIKLYEKLDFINIRELALLQCDDKMKPAISRPDDLELRPLIPDWPLLTTFWDGEPSWQNSIPAMERSAHIKHMVGAYIDDRCVGYIIFSGNFGRVAQFAVDRSMRNQGIGTALLQEMQTHTASGYSLQVINIDKAIPGVMDFFKSRGFYERLAQYEMMKTLQTT